MSRRRALAAAARAARRLRAAGRRSGRCSGCATSRARRRGRAIAWAAAGDGHRRAGHRRRAAAAPAGRRSRRSPALALAVGAVRPRPHLPRAQAPRRARRRPRRGAEALNTVRLPYLGKEPWVLTTVQLAGAGMCWVAAVLADWPAAGALRASRALLRAADMVASPVVSHRRRAPGAARRSRSPCSTAAFLLAGAARRAGPASALALAAAVARRRRPARRRRRPRGAVVRLQGVHREARRRRPGQLSTGTTTTGRSTGRARASSCSASTPTEPHYWKAQTSSTTSTATAWIATCARPGRRAPTTTCRRRPRARDWDADVPRRAAAAARRRHGRRRRHDARGHRRHATTVEPDLVPGPVDASSGDDLSKGDSYRVRAHVPRPTPDQLADAPTVGDGDRATPLRLAGRHPARTRSTRRRRSSPALPATAIHPDDARPSSSRRTRPATRPARRVPRSSASPARAREALRRSYYERTWALAARLRARVESPYDYLLRVNDYLRGGGFVYTEVPDRPAPGEAAAGVLPVRHQARLLPAVLGRDGAAAAHGRHPRARRDRLLARRPARVQRRVGRARHGRALVGRGVVRRHRLGDVRPDAAGHARPLQIAAISPRSRTAATRAATTTRARRRCATASRAARSATRAAGAGGRRRGRRRLAVAVGAASARCWRR